jgi:mono/diheme cytochrome c family protein
VINDKARYTLAEGPRIAQPGPVGAHSWHPMAYSPKTNLLYIPARESSIAYTVNPKGSMGNFNLFVDFVGGDKAYDEPGNKIPRGGDTKVMAWDPVQAREVWSLVTGGATVGMMATAGNVLFTGNSAKREMIALKADTGEQIWSYPVQAGIAAGSISYEVDGEQYVAQVVGGPSLNGYYAPTYARLLVFKLGGKARLPPNADYTEAPFMSPEQTATREQMAQGGTLYGGACAICHGDGGVTRGMFPDLRRSPLLASQAAFDQVVLGGIRKDKGMASFEGKLTAADTALIRAFMIDRAVAARNAPAFLPQR